MKDYELGKDVLTEKVFYDLDEIQIQGKSALVLELMH
jgi:hypothetical protein